MNDERYLAAKVREHHHAIITCGYRHDSGGVYESYPAHRISKVKTNGLQGTTYVDKVRDVMTKPNKIRVDSKMYQPPVHGTYDWFMVGTLIGVFIVGAFLGFVTAYVIF